MRRRLKLWILRRIGERVMVTLRKSGSMPDGEVLAALCYSEDASIMRAISELRARMEDDIMEHAWHSTPEARLAHFARLEGMNDFFKAIMAKRREAMTIAQEESTKV